MNWQMIGYMMVIYIAGLQNIPDDLEAASRPTVKLSPWQMLPKGHVAAGYAFHNHLHIPYLYPTPFKLFDQNLALTGGAPMRQTTMLARHLRYVLRTNRIAGVGQAKAVIFLLIVGLIAYVQLRVSRSREVEG